MTVALSCLALLGCLACGYNAATAYETYRVLPLRKWRDRAVAWGLAAVVCLIVAVCLWGVQGP